MRSEARHALAFLTPLVPLALLPLTLPLLAVGCGGAEERADVEGAAPRSAPPSVLLVTLDTTRADAVGHAGGPAATPTLDGLAARGTVLDGWATAPMTLPSHASMLTGLYPSEHGVHENARVLDVGVSLLAERLAEAGYRTAAFVSAAPLASTFGLDRGFEVYDDDFGDRDERPADETTDLALRHLRKLREAPGDAPIFLWVHYFDPHAPYLDHGRSHAPADAGTYGELGVSVANRYLSEVSFMDRALGRLIDGLEDGAEGEVRIAVVGDHGESLGEHGESTHGALLHEGVLAVPMILVGGESAQSTAKGPLSVRAIHGTVLDWAGLENDGPSALGEREPVVLAEAMQPHLQYGWQPHVAAVSARDRAVLFGSQETGASILAFDLRTDVAGTVSADLRAALRSYPAPDPASSQPEEDVPAELRARLSRLGYVSGSAAPSREDAPRAIDRTEIFDELEAASAAFEQGRHRDAVAPLEEILRQDPGNFAAALRLAVAHSVLGTGEAEAAFDHARELAPGSLDLQHYEGMHRLSRGELEEARVLFEAVLARQPRRPRTLEGLVDVHRRAGRREDTRETLRRLVAVEPTPQRWLELGHLEMARGATADAIAAFERARDTGPDRFDAELELGVLYLASRRVDDARIALDRALETAPPGSPQRSMALFKRAQVAVLLGEPDATERVRRAQAEADATTGPLIRSEQLFQEILQ